MRCLLDWGWIWDDLGVCVAPQRESCYELVAPAHVRICIVTSSSATPCWGQKGVEKSCWLENWMRSMGVPQCGMTNFHGENPGTVSILHGEDKGDMDHSEPGSVKVSRSLPSVRTRLHRTVLGAVGNLSKCRRASTLPILNERKFQFCFHLTHWDSKARLFLHLSWEMRGLLDWDGFGMIWVCVLPRSVRVATSW